MTHFEENLAKTVLRIRDILVRIRILGSVALTTDPDAGPGGPKTYRSYGSGSRCALGSGTLVHLHPNWFCSLDLDPDPRWFGSLALDPDPH